MSHTISAAYLEQLHLPKHGLHVGITSNITLLPMIARRVDTPRFTIVQLGLMRIGFATLALAGSSVLFTLSLDGLRGNSPQPLFAEIAQQSGIRFTHFNGMTGKYYYPEIVGSGVALFDYDGDGDLDVFLVQGNLLSSADSVEAAIFPPKEPIPLRCRLYRNDLAQSSAGKQQPLHFTDVTEHSKLDIRGYGMGVAVGDYNNDSHPDLYVTSFGANYFFRNNGDGTFTDVTRVSGTADERWGVSASFFDYDRDGWLDLFVGDYVDFRFTNQKLCFSPTSAREYCGPLAYEPLPNRVFHNRGDNTFEDVTAKSQMAREYGGALGSVAADFNRDGWIDLFVANDGRPNELWINQKNGTFQNEALLAGCALGEDGHAKAGMGVDAGDFDNDGDEDLILTQLKGEKCTLYTNNGKGWFEDHAAAAGLAAPSAPYTGFGTVFLDLDNDGWLDIAMVNGEVKAVPELRSGPYPLGQRNCSSETKPMGASKT